MKNATAVAAAAMANELAHQINNPLQSLTNTLFLLVHDDQANPHAQLLAEQASAEIARLSALVTKLLTHSRTNPKS
jgi:nitrogen-specific signal transduction histidine kinase